MDFKKLKESNSLSKLQKAVEEEQSKKNTGKNNPDEYWMPSVDKAGNGSAKIRFLPAPPQDGEDGLPWAKWYRYSFQGSNGWYIESSLSTFNKPDPCQEYNNRLWGTKIKANEDQARKQNRNLTICCNVEILQDPLHPENEGLVRKFKFGKKIWDKIQKAMDGDDDTPAFDPFSFSDGADFRLIIKMVKSKGDGDGKGFRNYDDSKFLSNSPRSNDDDFLESIWNKEFSLKSLLTPNNFKTYEELEKQLVRALGFNPNHESNKAPELPVQDSVITKPATIESKVTTTIVESETLPWDEPKEETDDLSFFKSLAED